MSARAIYLAVLSFMLMLSPAAYAVSWPELPAACTPERAAKWNAGISESSQAPCHCPPPSLCPSTYAEYSNPSLAKMPASLINRCCPTIAPATCPAGSSLAGQAVPANGNCNPTCPAGTALAGQAIPGDGNCNPAAPSNCAPKYYPTIAESGIPNANGVGTYTYQNGSRHNFSLHVDLDAMSNAEKKVVAKLATRYNFAIRLWDFADAKKGLVWMFAPLYCTSNDCPFQKFFIPNTGGRNDGTKKITPLASAIGANKAVWFGFTLANIDGLANNVMTPAMMAAWGGQDRIPIGAPSFMPNYGSLCIFGPCAPGAYQYQKSEAPAAIESGGAAFLKQCREAGGEFVELENKVTNGSQCAYMQCRYVYSGGSTESCLSGEVKLALADGSAKRVKDIQLGDVVKGSAGDHKVVASNIYQSALRVLYGINGGGELLTGDHPLHTKAGWKVINPESAKFYADAPGFAREALQVGDVLITEKGDVSVKSIERHSKVDPVSTYNIKVEGNAGFYANGIEVKGFDKMEMKYE